MDFVKKEWQFRDVISENELNRMEGGIEEGITKAEQAQGDISAHVARADNPHGVTKDQVGLGNVQNYPVASQSEAEAGTASNRYMTPQRTKQAIDALSPVKSVNGKTGDVVLTASDVGAPTAQQHDQLEQKVDAHVANTNNPHGVTKTQVGLGNVQNYGIATQAQAEAGTANNVYMTPLRTKQAITAQTGGVPLRINNGKLEYYDGTGWRGVRGFDPTSMTLNMINHYLGTVAVSASGYTDIFTLNGKGVLGELEVYAFGENAPRLGVVVVVDGVEKPLYDVGPSSTAMLIAKPANSSFSSDSSTSFRYTSVNSRLLYAFNSELRIRIRNVFTTNVSATVILKGGYYS